MCKIWDMIWGCALAVTRLAQLILHLNNLLVGARIQIKWHVIVYDCTLVLLESIRRCRTILPCHLTVCLVQFSPIYCMIKLQVKIYCEIQVFLTVLFYGQDDNGRPEVKWPGHDSAAVADVTLWNTSDPLTGFAPAEPIREGLPKDKMDGLWRIGTLVGCVVGLTADKLCLASQVRGVDWEVCRWTG